MSSTLTIEDKEYVTATVAGRHFEYTKEYMLLLIKQGKIDGRKVGHRWYVHIPSAEVFFTQAREARFRRNDVMSESRKIELKGYSKTHTIPKHRRMLIETLAVLVIALGIGTAGYMNTAPQPATVLESNTGFLEKLAISVYSLFSGGGVAVNSVGTIPVTATENTASTLDALSAQISTTTRTAVIVAPGEIFTATTVETVRDSFSDPVEVTVDPKNSDTGIITPIFKEMKGEEYRFLMAPVTTVVK